MERVRKFVFSKITTLFLLVVFLGINVSAFYAEYLFGKIDFDTEKWVRLLSILFDFIIVGFGILAWFQIHFRKSLVRSMKMAHKNLFLIRFLSDVLAGFCVIYLLYVLRLLVFWWYGRITEESLLNNALLGISGVLLFGFVNYLVRRTTKYLKKFFKERNLTKGVRFLFLYWVNFFLAISEMSDLSR